MNEKKLVYITLVNNYYEVREVEENSYCCRRLSPTGIIDLLNEQQSKIDDLNHVNEQLRKEKAQLTERLRECRIRLDKFNCR